MVFLVETVSRSLCIGGAARRSWTQACNFCYVIVQCNEQKFGFYPHLPLHRVWYVVLGLILLALSLRCFLNIADTIISFDNFEEFFSEKLNSYPGKNAI